MDLKQFITETVTSIVESTLELQRNYDRSVKGIVINPAVSGSNELLYQEDNIVYSYRRIEVIEFDVAVSASEGADKGGKAGLKIWSAEVGLDGKRNVRSEEVSRVKFAIPIALSRSEVEWNNRLKETSEPTPAIADSDYNPF